LELLIQSIVNGFIQSGFYALAAVGLVLIFGVMGVVNFAHGELVMVGAYTVWLLHAQHGTPFLLTIVIAIILVPILKQHEPPPIMEQAAEAPRFAEELADEGPAGLYSAAETEQPITDNAMPAAKSSVKVEASTATGQASAPALRANALSKSSIATEGEQRSDAPADDKRRSRMQAADSAPFAVLTPEMWEVRIAQLIDAGRINQARSELDQLKSHFPEHEIDRVLLEKLSNHHE